DGRLRRLLDVRRPAGHDRGARGEEDRVRRDRERKLGDNNNGPAAERRRVGLVSADARDGARAEIVEPRARTRRGHDKRARGTGVELATHMDETTTPTVEMSLAALSEAVGRASQDLSDVRTTLDRARADIATRNTSLG